MSVTNSCENYAKTLTESTFDFSITAEDVRGGQGNGLLGRYFHDSNMQVTLVDAMFDLQYMALSLGVNLESGGLSVKEEELAVGTDGTVTASETPVAFNGSMIGWYKKPSDTEWSIGTFTGSKMAISGASQNDPYCVKYFYINENAKSIKIKSQYVPSELHVVIMNDLYSGDVGSQSDATRYGRLITDIPRLQMDGNQTLNLTATSAATINLTGSALAVENSEIELATTESEALIVRAVFGSGMASQRKDNSNFTFSVATTPASTATGTTVDNKGVVKAGSQAGVAVIQVVLTGAPDVDPAFVTVTVTG